MSRHKLLHISSKDKSSGINSNFRLNLSQNYWLQSAKSIIVKHITIPHVFYNITADKASFTYEIANVPSTVNITPGNYKISELLSALTTAVVGDGVVGFTATLNPITEKIEFTSTTAIEYLDEVDGNAMASILGIMTGSGSDVNVFNAQAIPNLSGVQNIGIASSCFGENNALSSDKKIQDLIAIVPVTVSFGDVIQYITQHDDIDDFDTPSQKLGKNCTQVDIRVLDMDTKQELDLTNHDIDLVFKIFY
jgi:hypothetical protein